MTSWKTVVYALLIFFFVVLNVLSFLKLFLWKQDLPLSEKMFIKSSSTEIVNFANFQNGVLILSDAANSVGTYVWVVGGQADGVLLGGSGNGKAGQTSMGTLVYNPTVKGYTWTKPTGFPLPFIGMNFTKINL